MYVRNREHKLKDRNVCADLCQTVDENSKIWPVLFALNESLSNVKLCGLYHCQDLLLMIVQGGTPVIVCFVLLWLLTPSFLLPIFNHGYDRYKVQRFVNSCSPYNQDQSKEGIRFRGKGSIYSAPPSDENFGTDTKYV